MARRSTSTSTITTAIGDAPPLGRVVLPANRAFVVQLRWDADLGQGACAGRVEHVVSGAAATFRSLAELIAFVDDNVPRPPRPRTGALVD
jgi:hypothetical protein